METARDGREAVEVFQARQGKWAAVIMDLTMPEMGGEEALGQLRALDSQTPVFLSSGFCEASEPPAGPRPSAF